MPTGNCLNDKLIEPQFLTVGDVILIHRHGIEEHGGSPEIRDYNLIESATLAAAQTFGGDFLCQGIEEMAATYWYNLSQNHGFVDGNKRVAARSAHTFLLVNGFDLTFSDEEFFDLAMAVAQNKITKFELVTQIKRHLQELGSTTG